MNSKTQRLSGGKIMFRLIKILKPLVPVMIITITFGVLGFLAATAITTFGAIAMGDILGIEMNYSFSTATKIIIGCAIFRGILRYIEQYSGHFIAFKILAILRDKVYKSLRKLAPAKLESKEKGNLISIITSDIELLEVFYAHTIAPIAIAILTSSIIAFVLYKINSYFGLIGLIFYTIVGFIIPVLSSKLGSDAGFEYRNEFGKTNSFLLDSLRGIKEILLFGQGEERLKAINDNSENLNKKLKIIKGHEGLIRALTDITIMIAILITLYVGVNLYINETINLGQVIVALVLLASSFGPTVALSNLSNNLMHTFACAQRLFDVLDEVPAVKEVTGEDSLNMNTIDISNLEFKYKAREEVLLKDVNLNIKSGEKIAIIGESGSGKSTLLKLMMRFWDVEKGSIEIDNKNIKNIPTKSLRRSQSLVSQETFLFNDTIENNIKIGKVDASKEEVIQACKKASIHEFIKTLPKGYETNVGEIGSNLSSGEKQRLGIARAFLHDSQVLILDEPTSNLDTLNEAQILKSIKNECSNKTIIMVSHRKSSTAICDRKLYVKNNTLKFNI
ncbi:amino acid ABC transporter ATP-binding/permease protein [Paraclostridium sordellii]|uniref:amino acid ABC transporter ATP-binding/permease protein n=1 Tax=Paraclostridium sordellii TaxID=1505 RepID=UPI0005DC00B0|nr:ABC transporter ATP-binding protein [Paeniclostridium sordellii]CEQ19946.1 ABC transporter ATP-binding/permease [[Clostridium] sordellii] [Paeniclostridium sordellii]